MRMLEKMFVRIAAAGLLGAGLLMASGDLRQASAQDLDMKKVFRCAAKDKGGVDKCDKARGLLLNNCTTCHVFVAIVVQQFDKVGWDGLFERHLGRTPALNETQLGEIKQYLAANFNPDFDPPELPEELLKMWTAY